MAIVINGSGTVTGLAVGGLPDGTVDAGTLATNSVDSAELIDGAVDDSHMAAMAASKLTGALPAIDGASLTNLSTVGNLIGLVASNSGGSTDSPTITLEDNKNYIILIIFKYDYSSVWNSYELHHASVNGSGVVSVTEAVGYAGDVAVVTGTNTIHVHLNNSNYDAPLVMVYEGSTSQIDIS